MKNLLCVDCSICPIRKECDEIDDIIGVNKTLVGEHSLLTQIYAKGKADGRKEAIDEFKRGLINDGKVSAMRTLKIAEKLKEQEE